MKRKFVRRIFVFHSELNTNKKKISYVGHGELKITHPFHHGWLSGRPKPGNPNPKALKNGSLKKGVWKNGFNGCSWITTVSSSESLAGPFSAKGCEWVSISMSCGILPAPIEPPITSTVYRMRIRIYKI